MRKKNEEEKIIIVAIVIVVIAIAIAIAIAIIIIRISISIATTRPYIMDGDFQVTPGGVHYGTTLDRCRPLRLSHSRSALHRCIAASVLLRSFVSNICSI